MPSLFLYLDQRGGNITSKAAICIAPLTAQTILVGPGVTCLGLIPIEPHRQRFLAGLTIFHHGLWGPIFKMW